MATIKLQSLKWDADGELAPADRLQLLRCLIQQSLPDVQLELIAVLERNPTIQEQITTQIS